MKDLNKILDNNKVAIFLLFFFLFSSCTDDISKTYYETGEIESEIYIDENLDTTKIVSYSKKGEINQCNYFYPNKIQIIKVYNDTSNHMRNKLVFLNNKKKTTPKIDSAIIIYKQDVRYGIHRFYSQKDLMYNQEIFIINAKPIAFSYLEKLGDSSRYKKIQNRFFEDTLGVTENNLVFNERNKLLKNKSFGYIVHSKDTIFEGEDYHFKIEYLTDVMNMDTVYNGIDIGTLDTNLNISNITQSKGGLEKTDTFIIKKPSRGYHLITGIIRILGIDSIRNTYEKDIVFYHDFYVLPK